MSDKWRIAWVDDGVLVIDGKPHHAAPRGKQWNGVSVYLVDGSIPDVAVDYCCTGDVVGSPRPPHIHSIDFRCGGGYWTLRNGDAWALPDEPQSAKAVLQDIIRACADDGLTWAPTAASTARRLGKRVLPWLGSKGATLGQRYQEGWHAALTVGPMLVCKGGAPRAQQLDLRAAFLRGMRFIDVPEKYAPVPPGTPWEQVREWDGFIAGAVHVPESMYVGPLPSGVSGSRPWPVGIVGGVWPIAAVRTAESLGCRCLFVADGAVGIGDTRPLRPMHDAIAAVADERLRKALYTRWWSRWASDGWYSAVVPRATLQREYLAREEMSEWAAKNGNALRRRELSRMEWTFQPTWHGERRPDVSAMIAAAAWEPLVRTIATHGRDVVAAHVDALWTTRVAEVPTAYNLKGDGPVRFYSIGVYEHAGKVKTQGCPPHIKGRVERIKWAARGCAPGTIRGREWNGVYPSTEPNAVSEPIVGSLYGDEMMPHVPTWGSWKVSWQEAFQRSTRH